MDNCKQTIDNHSYDVFNNLKLFITTIMIPKISKDHKKICTSENNSKSINGYMENLVKMLILPFFEKHYENAEVYCGENFGDTPIETNDWVMHLDSKGVEVKREKKRLTIPEMDEILKRDNIDTSNFNKKRRKEFEDAIIEKKLEGYDNNFHRYSESLTEMFNDHKDENLHFKMSQSNLDSESLTGICNKKEVIYKGKLPKDTKKPHLTFILKHLYSKDGIQKLVLYSIPHQICQNEYPDIQMEGNKKRTPKAADEFRFNMNDSNNKPYKFIGSDVERYWVCEI